MLQVMQQCYGNLGNSCFLVQTGGQSSFDSAQVMGRGGEGSQRWVAPIKAVGGKRVRAWGSGLPSRARAKVQPTGGGCRQTGACMGE